MLGALSLEQTTSGHGQHHRYCFVKEPAIIANITFTYDEIETAATQLGNGKEEITTKLQGMQTQIQTFLTSTATAMRELDAQIASKIN